MATRRVQVPARSQQKGEFFEFTVDAALLKELGERLVGKPHIALAELVKNAYDADARELRVTFVDAESAGGSLLLIDDGNGMSREQLAGY